MCITNGIFPPNVRNHNFCGFSQHKCAQLYRPRWRACTRSNRHSQTSLLGVYEARELIVASDPSIRRPSMCYRSCGTRARVTHAPPARSSLVDVGRRGMSTVHEESDVIVHVRAYHVISTLPRPIFNPLVQPLASILTRAAVF